MAERDVRDDRPAWEQRDDRAARDYRDTRDYRDYRDSRDFRDFRDSHDLQDSRDNRDARYSRKDAETEADLKSARDEAYCRDLLELQKVDFALVELSLFLDTHPMDLQAVQQLNQLSQKRRQLADEFEMKYGPLMQFGHSYSRYPWQWIETPWPWQV